MPAPVQITAEQLLREAKERELELVQPVCILAQLSLYLYNLMYTHILIISRTVNFTFIYTL